MSSNSLYSRVLTKDKRAIPKPHHSSDKPNESANPRPMLKSMLLPNETLLQVGIVSSGIYWKSIAVLIFAALFMFLMFLVGLPRNLMLLFGISLSLKLLFMFTLAWLTKHYLLLAATDKRIIIRSGIVNLEVIQMRYSKVESNEISSSIPGRYFGYSSVFVSGTGGHTLAIPYIANAVEFRKTITEILLNRDDLEVHQGSAA